LIQLHIIHRKSRGNTSCACGGVLDWKASYSLTTMIR
jgi:hypothetical protein